MPDKFATRSDGRQVGYVTARSKRVVELNISLVADDLDSYDIYTDAVYVLTLNGRHVKRMSYQSFARMMGL